MNSILHISKTIFQKSQVGFAAVTIRMSSNCVFCKIVSKETPSNILHEDEQFLVFPDISPAGKHHLLVIPKEHIVEIRSLTSKDIPLVQSMEQVGLSVLEKTGGDPSSCLTGFHWPLHSVSHLHMHVISPQVEGWVKSVQFSGCFFGSTESAVKMLEGK
eukprot:GFUD01054106.1.p1 GENE.GFUD01054106.1~~GFUD01054106.1.p1  ORF type:complete len:159 (-),score=45.84 GFUD01054106.1:141-617(-)